MCIIYAAKVLPATMTSLLIMKPNASEQFSLCQDRLATLVCSRASLQETVESYPELRTQRGRSLLFMSAQGKSIAVSFVILGGAVYIPLRGERQKTRNQQIKCRDACCQGKSGLTTWKRVASTFRTGCVGSLWWAGTLV